MHTGARNVGNWLGLLAWILLVLGLIGAGFVLVDGTSCDQASGSGLASVNCDEQRSFAITWSIVIALNSVVVALIFAAIRYVLMLLTEIAEKPT
jgi:hypothetical protein